MKKIILNLTAIAFTSLILTSCGGNSIENDAKKYAELMCKAKKMALEGVEAAAAGDMSTITESEELATEAASFAQEMQDKYEDADYLEFSAAYSKAIGNCK